jgi:hypothetical protein
MAGLNVMPDFAFPDDEGRRGIAAETRVRIPWCRDPAGQAVAWNGIRLTCFPAKANGAQPTSVIPSRAFLGQLNENALARLPGIDLE